jgi:AMP-polyphosphate phosphotransferase
MTVRLKDVDPGLRVLDAKGRPLTKAAAETRLLQAQNRLLALRLVCGGLMDPAGRPRAEWPDPVPLGPGVLCVFEGWDASGKGGAIKRLTAPLDPRHVRVATYAAPTYDEKRHHFLQRFFPAMPGRGGMTVLDRSWYGRVLVERVEGFATKSEWSRAYKEIVAFEDMLAAEGTVIVKFWMHISPEVQAERFAERARNPLKGWKLTDEDWRNRERWDDYAKAVDAMLERTDRPGAPWVVVPGDDKRSARIRVVETVVSAIEASPLLPTGSTARA